MNVKIKFRLTDHKNKFIVLGDSVPEEMILPVIIDMSHLRTVLDEIIGGLLPGKHVNIESSEIDKATLIISIEDKEP
jgi:hypothetical protein